MKKLGILLLTVLCIFSFLKIGNTPVQAAQQRYGYTLLTNDIQRSAYRTIADGIAAVMEKITFTVSEITSDNMESIMEEIQMAEKMVVKDYPEYFWFNGKCSISIDGTSVTVTPDKYTVGGETVTAGSAKLNAAKNQLEQAISAALAKFPSSPSDYEKAHILHDFIVDRVEYLQQGDHQTAYGALVTGKAVCAGYARAYQLLMNRAGIPCAYIGGESYDPTGKRIAHAWNLVWLDGKCYHTDVTWDDQGSDLFHEYLNMSKEEMSKTHFPGASEKLPASCGHDDYRFFLKNRGEGVCDIQNTLSDADVANSFILKSQSSDQAVYYCTIHYHGNDFYPWLNNHHAAITDILGFVSYEISIIELGHEHHVTISGQLRPVATQPTAAPTQSGADATQPPTTASAAAPTVATTAPTQPSTSPATAAPTQAATKTTESTAATNPTETSTQAATQSTEPTVSTTVAPTDDTQATQPTEFSAPNQTEATEETVTTPTEITVPAADPQESDDFGSLWIIIPVVFLVAAASVTVLLVIYRKKA